jgi:hypothetical protein
MRQRRVQQMTVVVDNNKGNIFHCTLQERPWYPQEVQKNPAPGIFEVYEQYWAPNTSFETSLIPRAGHVKRFKLQS